MAPICTGPAPAWARYRTLGSERGGDQPWGRVHWPRWQSEPAGQVPQSSTPPHPSLAAPQATFWAAQVVALQPPVPAPQWLGTPAPPQVWPGTVHGPQSTTPPQP